MVFADVFTSLWYVVTGRLLILLQQCMRKWGQFPKTCFFFLQTESFLIVAKFLPYLCLL